MKQVFPNITGIVTQEYIHALNRLRRLRRYWGTTTINGVEVFVERNYFYPSMTERFTKFAKFTGIYKDLTAKQEGIRDAWLYLNPSKAPTIPEDVNLDYVAQNLQTALKRLMESGGGITITIGAKVESKNKVNTITPVEFTNPVSDQVSLIQEVQDKILDLYADNYTIEVNDNDDPYITALVAYALVYPSGICTITSVAETLSYLDEKVVLSSGIVTDKLSTYKSYVVSLQFNNTTINSSSPIAVAVRRAITGKTNNVDKQISLEIRSNTASVYRDLQSTPDNIWLKVPDGSYQVEVSVYDETTGDYITTHEIALSYKYYLKASFFSDKNFDKEFRIKYFSECIDTGYRKKKVKWYQKVLAFAIIVVAVILAAPTGGASITTAWAAIAYIATIITVASLYIALTAYALNLLGHSNVAGAMGQFLKTVEPLVQIAGVYLIVYAITQKAMEEMAKKELARQTAGETAKNTLVDMSVNIVQATVEQVTGVVVNTNMTTQHWLKLLSFTFDTYTQWENRNLEKEIDNKRNELAKLEEAQVHAQTSDILKQLAISQPQLLARDSSIYAEKYDRPYEWWSTPYHTGNIQATTVNALSLSDV